MPPPSYDMIGQKMHKDKPLLSAGHSTIDNDEWNTPEKYIEAARRTMGSIDLDPATNAWAQRVIRAGKHYTKAQDSLKPGIIWRGNIWMNPPYSKGLCCEFCNKLIREHQTGRVIQAVALLNSSTDTEYYQRMINAATAFLLHARRISFVTPGGQPAKNNSKGQTFFYFGENVDFFCREFGSFGTLCSAKGLN